MKYNRAASVYRLMAQDDGFSIRKSAFNSPWTDQTGIQSGRLDIVYRAVKPAVWLTKRATS